MCPKKIFLLLALYLVGCSHQEHHDWKDIKLKSKIEDYFTFALVYPEPAPIDSIYNFLGKKLKSENISIISLTYTGTDNFKDSCHFRLCAYKSYEDPGNVHFRNAFEIILSEQDSIYYGGHYDRIENLNLALDEFLFNPNNLNTLSEKRIIDTKYLGKVEVSRGMIGIRWTSQRNELSNPEYLSLGKNLARVYVDI